MDTQKVIDVISVDVFGYKISRFKLQIFNEEHTVSRSEEGLGALVVGLNSAVPLSLSICTPVLRITDAHALSVV